MIIALFRFIRGFLEIKLEGVSSERILSAMANEKIYIWNLKYSAGTISADIYARDFRKLRKARRGTGVKVKITSKHGLPFLRKRYGKRSGFFVGAVIFFAILKFLSMFIWVINVDGNITVKERQIVNTLNEIGIFEGVRASGIDAKNSAQNLLLKCDKLAWASLNIEGSVLNVNLSEIKEKINSDGFPSNLIADTDGIIKKIDAVSGNVKVTVGQNVHKGDILVSGIIENMTTTVFVKSNAVITAQIEKTYSKRLDFVQTEKHLTGKKTRYCVFEFFAVKVPLYISENTGNTEVKYSYSRLHLFDKKIPVKVYIKEYKHFKNEEKHLNENQLTSILDKKLKDYLSEHNIEGYIPISTEYVSDYTGITVTHKYLCDENIALENEIMISQ